MRVIFIFIKKAMLAAFLMCALAAGAIAAPEPAAEELKMIPHSIESYEINRNTNACVMCHRKENSPGGAQNISATHYVNRDGLPQKELSGSRYFCTACHASVFEEPAKK